MRETLGSVRSKLARSAGGGKCANSQEFVDRLNEATQRLVARGKWKGLVRRYVFCTQNACVSLPREIETILTATVDDAPYRMHDHWYEFLDSGPGPQTPDSAKGKFAPRGQSPVAFDPCGTDKRVRVYCDVAEAAGARILIQGLDENGNRVRTLDGGSYVDGEYVSLTNPYAESTSYFSAITGTIKPATNGFVRLYSIDDADSLRFLAVYHPSDTQPLFRRYLIPGIPEEGACVKCLVKLRYLPVSSDEDELLISNVSALRFMLMALHKWECNLPAEAAAYEAMAIEELNHELKEHTGVPVSRLRVESGTWMTGDIKSPN